jgi:hypothetical protein
MVHTAGAGLMALRAQATFRYCSQAAIVHELNIKHTPTPGAGSYKYSYLSQRATARASKDKIDIHITVRHHGVVSGHFSDRNQILDSIPGYMPCYRTSSAAFVSSLATSNTHPALLNTHSPNSDADATVRSQR